MKTCVHLLLSRRFPTSSVICLALAGLLANAAVAQTPHWGGLRYPVSLPVPTDPAPARPASPSVSALSGGVVDADFVTPELSALARGCLDDPARILDHVMNHIRYEHYYGCRRGAMRWLPRTTPPWSLQLGKKQTDQTPRQQTPQCRSSLRSGKSRNPFKQHTHGATHDAYISSIRV
ncbi:MAG: hypothetical protein KDK99_06290 [Verrucomicrobiales bacterium]|nr:hypothetical protein [Verrucomicrobiales bacterium]